MQRQSSSYIATERVLQLRRRLRDAPRQRRAVNDLAASMGVHRRTVLRWARLLDALDAHDPKAERVLRERGEDGRAWLRLERPRELEPGPTPYQAAAALLAVQALGGASGSLLSDCARDLLSTTGLGSDLSRSFYFQPIDPRSYRAHDETVDQVLRAVVQRRQITFRRRADHEGPLKTFEPWTLITSGGAIYVYGLDVDRSAMRTWAVERMAGVTLTQERFQLPDDYDPSRVLAEQLGVWVPHGEPVPVVARFSERVWNAVAARRLPGEVDLNEAERVLTWRIAVSPEVVTWFVRWAAEVEVLSPAALRGRVADAHRAAVEVYAKEAGT